MNNFNVGNTWEESYLDEIILMNRANPQSLVTELYGNVSNVLNSVRPDYRVKEKPIDLVRTFINKAIKSGIDVNYAFNRSCVGEVSSIFKDKDRIQYAIDWLTEAGVKRFTVASPLLIENFRFPAVELSTIFNQLTIKQITQLVKLSPKIDKICLPIYLNRDFVTLVVLRDLLLETGVKIELIVNEFCAAEGGICVRRDECYNNQSHGGNQEKHFDNYPVGSCIEARSKDPANWLRAPFILPEHLTLYRDMGITNFKITGRTHTPKTIIKVISYYVDENFDGSLCELWGIPLEKIYSEFNYHPIDIRTKDLLENKFINGFLSGIKCLDEVCDVTCRHCKNVYEKVTKNEEKKS